MGRTLPFRFFGPRPIRALKVKISNWNYAQNQEGSEHEWQHLNCDWIHQFFPLKKVGEGLLLLRILGPAWTKAKQNAGFYKEEI